MQKKILYVLQNTHFMLFEGNYIIVFHDIVVEQAPSLTFINGMSENR